MTISTPGTFYDLTLERGRYATKAQVRAAVMGVLRHYSFVSGLATTAERASVADRFMSDDLFMRRCRSQVIASVGRDILDAHLRTVKPA